MTCTHNVCFKIKYKNLKPKEIYSTYVELVLALI